MVTHLDYLRAGLSCFPIRRDGTKAPTVEWTPFRSRLPTEAEAQDWAGLGIAIPGGPINGGLEILDFETDAAWREWLERCPLPPGLPVVVTPGGGRHVYYRCAVADGNLKLARNEAKETLIETRGDGGYVLAPGSPADCHPTGREYVIEVGSLSSIGTVTAEQREDMHAAARSLCRVPPEEYAPAKPATPSNGDRPGDDFDRETSWPDVLEPHGWTVSHRKAGVVYWKRPGKDGRGWSATTGHCGDRLYVFSSNAAPFDSERVYGKFAAFALLNHDGDFKQAARDLRRCGFGGQAADPNTPADDAPKAYMPTDYGNAERLVDAFGYKMHYVPQWSAWLLWDGKRWKQDATGRIERFAKKTLREMRRQAVASENEAALKHWLDSEKKRQRMLAMIANAASEPGIPAEPGELDRHPWLLNAQNCTVDLRTGAALEFAREHLMTKIAGCNYSPDAACPTWTAFLDTIFGGDLELISFVHRAIGYSLTGDVSEHVLFVCYGTGGNGKSVLLNTILGMLGDYGRKAAPDLLMHKESDRHPTEVADLFGSRFVASIEIEAGRRLAEALVKDLTGGDRRKARRMREDFWEYEPTDKMWLAVNHRPDVRGSDMGIWRRLLLVPFTVQITAEQRDKHLAEKLREEWPGILAWAVRGCREWAAFGLCPPAAVLSATDEFRAEMDWCRRFLSDRCKSRADSRGAETPCNEIYAKCCEWREQEGMGKISRNYFGRKMTELGYRKRDINSVDHYQNIELRS